MKTINTLLLEVAAEPDKSEIKNITLNAKECVKSKEKCLVEILKKIIEDKS